MSVCASSGPDIDLLLRGRLRAKRYVTSREMSGPLETLAASAPLCAAIAAAVGLGCVRKVYRMPIELSRVPRRDAVPAVSKVFSPNSR